MRVTTVPFSLREWRLRMMWTQEKAAAELYLSIDGYRRAEYRCMDRPHSPCNATLARLAVALEDGLQPAAKGGA
jgi:hypothetical protein